MVNLALSPFGVEIRRRIPQPAQPDAASPTARVDGPRNSMRGLLEQCKKLGFHPQTIFDVGVGAGTPALYRAFPDAKLVLIEPLAEFRPCLEKIMEKYPNACYFPAAASKESGDITIHVHPDLVGSSLYLEDEDSNVNGEPRVVPAITLDEICEKNHFEGPYLIKVDVQGAELQVLQGGSQVFDHTELVILEVVLFQFFVGGSQFFDVISFMKQRGFVAYDIFDPHYRPLDHAMSQVDIAFVKEFGEFRKVHFFATREQRESATEQMIQDFLREKENPG